MNLEAQDEPTQEPAKEAQQLLNVMLAQGGELPDNRVYLDGCSTVTAFKNNKFLTSIKTDARGVKINCNVGVDPLIPDMRTSTHPALALDRPNPDQSPALANTT